MATPTLTPEQTKFLKECETEFAQRYTAQDKEWVQFQKAPKVDPPCVFPWQVRAGGRSGGRGGGRGQFQRSDREGDYQRERHRERHHHHGQDERDRYYARK